MKIRTAIVLAAVLLVAAACGSDNSGGSSGGAMTISIKSPADGAQVTEPFTVEVDTSVPVGEPSTGRHHVHLYYDGATAEGEYDIVYANSAEVTRLSPGQHVIEAVIANADHSTTDARQKITVNVGAGAPAGGGETTTTTVYGY
jgi:hypothetical protein